MHPLIFCPELFKREFASPVADMRNSVKNRDNAQSSCAAQFIYWHIEDTSADWCHIDLAGRHSSLTAEPEYGTALMVDVVRRLSASANDRD
ncbi:MAG: hypothetical protein H6837_12885 [Planctomycetes bacterium]|nr:hypothetical protein [Planctomycetota bacterium]